MGQKRKRKLIKKYAKLIKIKKLSFSVREINNFTVLYANQIICSISMIKYHSTKIISLNTQKSLTKKSRKSKYIAWTVQRKERRQMKNKFNN